MKARNKSVSILVLVLVLSMALLPSCAAGPVTAKQTTSAATAAMADLSQFAKLKFMMLGDEGPDTDRIWELINAKLKTDLNCSVEMECISWSDWATKYPLVFASGEEFDLVYTSNWAFYATEAIKGAFYELTDASLRTYMPKTYATVTANQWTQTKVNGKIFMIPVTFVEFGDYKSVFLVRGDLMEKYGIDAIKTTSDMTAYWDAVIKNDPDITPIALGNSDNGLFGQWLMNIFVESPYYGDKYYSTGYNIGQTIDLSDPKNIKVIDTKDYELQRYKLLKEFKDKGYWSEDASTQLDDCLVMFENGKSATALRIIGNINGLYAKVVAKHPEWDPQIIDLRPEMSAWLNPKTNDGMAIHATSKNPERSMMVLDLLGYDESYYNLIHYGVENTDYKKNADGTTSSLNPSFDCSGGMGITTTLQKKPEVRAPNFDAMFEAFGKNAITPPLAMFNFDSSSVDTQTSAVNAVKGKYATILNLGFADDVEATYDEFMAALQKAGIDDIRAEYLKQAQEFMNIYGD